MVTDEQVRRLFKMKNKHQHLSSISLLTLCLIAFLALSTKSSFNKHLGGKTLHGYLKYLGLKVSPSTINRILREHGIEPCPDRPEKTSWNEFIKSHWDSLAAIDFFTSATCRLLWLTVRLFENLIIDLTCCSASSSLPGRAAGVIRRCEASGTK